MAELKKRKEERKMDSIMSLLSTSSGPGGKEKEKGGDIFGDSHIRRSKKEKEERQKIISQKVSQKQQDSMSGETETCKICNMTVYLAEKVEVEIGGKIDIYHKHCFRCNDCSIQLRTNGFGSSNRILYCLSHLKDHREDKLDFDSTANQGDHKRSVDARKQVKSQQKAVSEMISRHKEERSCYSCGKEVFKAEGIEIEAGGASSSVKERAPGSSFLRIYHRGCFKCSHCGTSLNLRNHESSGELLFCKAHISLAGPTQAKGEYFISPLKHNLDEETAERGSKGNESELSKDVHDVVVPKESQEESISIVTEEDEFERRRKERQREREERRKQLGEEEDSFEKRRKEREERLRSIQGSTQVDDEDLDSRAKRREERLKKLQEDREREEKEAEERRMERMRRRQMALEGIGD